MDLDPLRQDPLNDKMDLQKTLETTEISAMNIPSWKQFLSVQKSQWIQEYQMLQEQREKYSKGVQNVEKASIRHVTNAMAATTQNPSQIQFNKIDKIDHLDLRYKTSAEALAEVCNKYQTPKMQKDVVQVEQNLLDAYFEVTPAQLALFQRNRIQQEYLKKTQYLANQTRSADGPIREPDGHINTFAMMSKLKDELRKRGISQKKFAENVLGRQQGTLNEMFKAPKPWEMCKSVKRVYEAILVWLELPEEDKELALQKDSPKAPKKKLLEGEASSPAAKRFRFSPDQRNILINVFKEWSHPNKSMIQKIANVMEIQEKSVNNFFLNTRRRTIDTEKVAESNEAEALIDMLKKYEKAGEFDI